MNLYPLLIFFIFNFAFSYQFLREPCIRGINPSCIISVTHASLSICHLSFDFVYEKKSNRNHINSYNSNLPCFSFFVVFSFSLFKKIKYCSHSKLYKYSRIVFLLILHNFSFLHLDLYMELFFCTQCKEEYNLILSQRTIYRREYAKKN